ncbi:carbohydrate-binding domain-containing protein, partial [Falsiroseomonas sp. E2-1-a20]|uniref:carbohydrate-binding domain-containing protein n=1 Tax=Falsiroseomonas sp. E2-1-a20 TaxID=3239300 RepID=UPI003F31C603
ASTPVAEPSKAPAPATPPPATPALVAPAPEKPVIVTPAPDPVKLDVLKIGIAQDAWQGDARYTISLDGKQIGGERVAKASAAKGEMDIITLTGDFNDSVHKLGVTFLNDLWGGTAKTDRNLYVEKLILNDIDLKKSADLLINGTAKFEFKAAAEAVPAATIGSGPDVLRVALSQDAYKGDATFLLFLDGKQLGGLRSVDASHAAGERDFIEIRGDFDPGDHILGVRFTNDLWGGTASADRNLYVESLELNSANLNAQAALLSNGDVFLQF